MAKCISCGVETQAFKIHEGGEWNWYCGKCYSEIKEQAKNKKYIKQLKQLQKKAKPTNQITKLGLQAGKSLRIPTIRAKSFQELLTILGEK